MADPTPDEMLNSLAAQPAPDTQQSESSSVSVQAPAEMTPEQMATARKNVGEKQADLAAIDPEAAAKEGQQKLEGVKQADEERTAPINEQAQKLGQLSDAVQTDIDNLTTTYQEQQKAYDESLAQQQAKIQHLDKMSKDIAANSTPRDFWADKSTGYKLGAAIFAGLGQFAGTQAPVQIIDNAINRDLTLQRLKLQNMKEDYATQNSLLGQMRAVYKDTRDADKAAYLAGLQGAKGKLEAIARSTNDLNIQKSLAQTSAALDQKIADASADLVSKSVDQQIKQKKGLADTQVQLEKLGAAQNGLQKFKAETARMNAERQEKHEGREEAAIQIPDWEGQFSGDKKAAEDFRVMDADTTTAVRSLEKLRKLAGTTKNLSWDRWQELSADANRAILWLKGKGIANAGANFTEMEKELLRKAYTGAGGEKMLAFDPTTKKRILEAEQDLFQRVKDYGEKHGLKPAATHEFLGEE